MTDFDKAEQQIFGLIEAADTNQAALAGAIKALQLEREALRQALRAALADEMRQSLIWRHPNRRRGRAPTKRSRGVVLVAMGRAGSGSNGRVVAGGLAGDVRRRPVGDERPSVFTWRDCQAAGGPGQADEKRRAGGARNVRERWPARSALRPDRQDGGRVLEWIFCYPGLLGQGEVGRFWSTLKTPGVAMDAARFVTGNPQKLGINQADMIK